MIETHWLPEPVLQRMKVLFVI